MFLVKTHKNSAQLFMTCYCRDHVRVTSTVKVGSRNFWTQTYWVFLRLSAVPGRPPVRSPFPHITDGVVESVTIRLKGRHLQTIISFKVSMCITGFNPGLACKDHTLESFRLRVWTEPNPDFTTMVNTLNYTYMYMLAGLDLCQSNGMIQILLKCSFWRSLVCKLNNLYLWYSFKKMASVLTGLVPS